MATFEIEGVDQLGTDVKLTIEAEDGEEALAKFRAQHYYPTKFKHVSGEVKVRPRRPLGANDDPIDALDDIILQASEQPAPVTIDLRTMTAEEVMKAMEDLAQKKGLVGRLILHSGRVLLAYPIIE